MTQDTLFQQLKHPNPNLRERAMWEIVDTRDETTISRLMDILDDEDVVYRRAAVKTLGAIGTDATPLIVESLLNSDNVTVRGSCAKALAQIAVNYRDVPFPVEGLQGLKASLNDPNPVVHIASAMALGEVGAPAFDILAEALSTTDNLGLAVAIVNGLASIGDEQAREVLTQLINDESVDTYVRETATSALSRLELVMKNQPR
ncbi:MAG: HEAT repeat domain-containing protein [Nostocaceae cyanobacterium]|nr:HEAT repeat domain-containing protein [Nostocaceae cyanobacterium]